MKKKNLYGKPTRNSLPCEEVPLHTSYDFVK